MVVFAQDGDEFGVQKDVVIDCRIRGVFWGADNLGCVKLHPMLRQREITVQVCILIIARYVELLK